MIIYEAYVSCISLKPTKYEFLKCEQCFHCHLVANAIASCAKWEGSASHAGSDKLLQESVIKYGCHKHGAIRDDNAVEIRY